MACPPETLPEYMVLLSQGQTDVLMAEMDAWLAALPELTSFILPAGSPAVASMHVVDISADSRAHYHKKMTEIYYVLEGTGRMELDGEEVELRPGKSVLIRPGCVHRAVGNLKILNVPVPAFDPEDEWFED